VKFNAKKVDVFALLLKPLKIYKNKPVKKGIKAHKFREKKRYVYA